MLQWQQPPPSAGSLAARLSPKLLPFLQSEHKPPCCAAVHVVHALIQLWEYSLYCKDVNTICESVDCKQNFSPSLCGA